MSVHRNASATTNILSSVHIGDSAGFKTKQKKKHALSLSFFLKFWHYPDNCHNYSLYSDLSSFSWQLTYSQVLATATSNVIVDGEIIGEEPCTETLLDIVHGRT